MPNWTKEQTDAIYKSGTNIIVSAGAGSGKTAVLSERVIEKIKNGINVNELLILTFTKAAAKEMKDRIRRKIKKDDSLKKQLELIESSYITTFDSFSLSILKKYHYILNIDKNITIADTSLLNIKKEEILDNIFNTLYEEENSKFENFIGTFCIREDKEIKNNLLNIYSKLEIMCNKDDYLNNYIINNFNDQKINKDIKEFENLLLKKLEEIKYILKDLELVVSNDYYLLVKSEFNDLINCSGYDEIVNNINVKIPTLPKNSEDEVKDIKKNLNNKIAELKDLCRYPSISYIYNSIMSTKDYLEIIIEILKRLDKEVNKYKNTYSLYDFSDISLLAIKILKENEDIKNEVKNSFKEIMIDEYQDTSDIQEEFISLIANNNVYMVGDIKQSIYRFRNANPFIFKNKYNQYELENGGIKIDLNKNFRSRSEVINNINNIFDRIMDFNIGGCDYSKNGKMFFGNMTYENEGKKDVDNDFEILNYEYDKKNLFNKEEIEAFIIANDIKNKVQNNYQIFDKDKLIIRNALYSDFVILMDKSTNFNTYKKIFEYLNVPMEIDKDESIINEDIMKVIKNLLSLINKIYIKEYDVEFRHLYMSVARSFLIEESDDKLYSDFVNNNIFNSKLFIKCQSLSKKLDHLNIKNFLLLIIDEFNIYENIIKIGSVNENISIIDYLLDITCNFIKKDNTIKDFINYLNKLTESGLDIKINRNKENSMSVKIMTIHKSKGLEFPVCYYASLYSKFNIKDLNDKFLFSNKYGIVIPYYDEGIDYTIYKILLKNDYIKEEISEKIRLLYVALTRAKEKMIFVGDFSLDKLKNKIDYRSFSDVILSIKDVFKNHINNINLDNLNISNDYKMIKKNNYQEIIEKTKEKISTKEIKIDNDIKEEHTFSKHNAKLMDKEEMNLLKTGTDVHYLLEVLDFKNPDVDGLNTSLFIKNKIKNLLNNEIFLNIKDGTIYKEYEFCYESDNNIYHGIIDLMIIYNDYIDIIDYKLKNINDENYEKQLNGYKEFIEKKTSKKVNVYLYSIIDEKLKQLIN